MVPGPTKETAPNEKIRANPQEQSWECVDRLIFETADRIRQRAFSVIEQRLESREHAEDILQNAAISVARTLRSKPQEIEDLEAYLFRAVFRELEAFVDCVEPVDYIDSEALDRLARDDIWAKKLEDDLFMKEFVGYMDYRTRKYFTLRTEGHSWRHIGQLFGISSHVAEQRYSDGIRRAVTNLLKDNPSLRPDKNQKA